MYLASFLNKAFKKDGFILIDANSKEYIIGNPGNNPAKPAPISQRSQAPSAAENPMRRKLVILNFNKVFAVIF